MSEEMTPSVPETVETTMTAEEFVKAELIAERKSLNNIRIFGSLLVIILSAYLIAVTGRFTYEMKPEVLTDTALGMVSTHIEANRDAFVAEVGTRVPSLIQEVPDMVMKQMPPLREEAEKKFEEGIDKFADANRSKLEANLAKYIEENKEEIKAVLEASKDPDAVKELGPAIREEAMAYLKEKPENGPSVDEQIQESLKQLKDAETLLHRLATAKNLTPAEQKTKRAIGIIAHTVDMEDLMTLPLPKLKAAVAEEE